MGYKKIILLFGPTASGKSKLAIDIAKNLMVRLSMQIACKFIKKLKFYLRGQRKKI